MIAREAMRAATIALFAVAVSVASPSVSHAQDLSCDQGEMEVRRLEFRGNRAVSDDELEVRVTTTPSAFLRRNLRIAIGAKRCLNRDELPRDLLGLKAYYRERGFYNARVDTLVQPMGLGAVRVVFTIDEGAPIVVKTYDVLGLEGVPDSAALVNSRRLRVGQPFDFGLYLADMDSIVQRLRNAGYFRASVSPPVYEARYDSLIAHVTISVTPGRQARFGEPQFEVTPVDERGQQLATPVVRRVLGILPGTLFSDRAIIEAQRNLFALGTYRHIEVAPDSVQPPGDSIVILRVRLSEDYMRQVDGEFGWATLDCVRTRAQYIDRNWLGTARRFELTAQATKIGYGEPLASEESRRVCDFNGRSPLRQDFEFSRQLHYYTGMTVRQPRLLGTRWVPTLSLYSERRGEYIAYLRNTFAGADLSASREIANRTSLRLGYSVEYGFTKAPDAALCALFNRCDPLSRAAVTNEATLGVASAAVTRIRTDNPITPSRGYTARAEARSSASSVTSSSLFFNKATGDIAFYRPMAWRNVLAVRLRGGGVTGRRRGPTDPVGFIPPQERLYAGGATSVRGYQQNELGRLVYIGSGAAIDTILVSGGANPRYRMEAVRSADSVLRIDRTVPLGGNALFVANVDYRIRDPFLFPDLLQYTLFVDAGEVWAPKAGQRDIAFTPLRVTPGFGIRALTPVGPVQVNIGYNSYPRQLGALFYNPNVSTLFCVTPNNTILLQRNSTTQQLEQVDPTAPCDATFGPPPRDAWSRLTFTFSIGPDF
jgi:outer membrane protein insertion porin family